jgi:hypothetical protein
MLIFFARAFESAHLNLVLFCNFFDVLIGIVNSHKIGVFLVDIELQVSTCISCCQIICVHSCFFLIPVENDS